jgi:hypothetical protein
LAASLLVAAAPPARDSRAADVRYAACVVAKGAHASARLVRSAPGSGDEKAALLALGSRLESCAHRVLKDLPEPDPVLTRGLLAERLWLGAVARFSGPGTPVDPNATDFETGFDVPPALQDRYRLARCVVYVDAVDTDGLIRTAAGSDAEQTAFGTLRGPIASCLANGHTLAMSKPALRAMLAEQLYRQYPQPR